MKDVLRRTMQEGTEDKRTMPRDAYARLFVLKKTERISAVNALLEQYLTERNEFKDLLLKKTFSLYEGALALYTQRFGPIKDTAERVKDLLRALEGLYEIGRHGRILADETATLLIQECRALRFFVRREFLEEEKTSSDSPGALADERMFAVEDTVREELREGAGASHASPYAPRSEIPRAEGAMKRSVVKDGLYMGQEIMSDNSELSFTPPRVQVGSAWGREKKDTLRKTAPVSSKQDSATMRHKDRRARILALLQRNERVSIKDVARAITGCSEKTLQRELAALVAQGVLKKEGERRWSTYSLA